MFFGDPFSSTGVLVNLLMGAGRFADAEGDAYFNIEDVVGSEFDDVLVDSRGDNNLRGEGGDDVLVATDGIDLLVGGAGRDHYVLTTARGTKYLDVCEATANASSSDVIHIPNLPHLYHMTDHAVFRILASNAELSLSFSPAKMWKSVVDFFLLRPFDVSALYVELNVQPYLKVNVLGADCSVRIAIDGTGENISAEEFRDQLDKNRYCRKMDSLLENRSSGDVLHVFS